MPYPSRPCLQPLPQFAASARPGARISDELRRFVVDEYRAGRSLRELAELTGRSHSAVRNILARAGEYRRGVGAYPTRSDPGPGLTAC